MITILSNFFTHFYNQQTFLVLMYFKSALPPINPSPRARYPQGQELFSQPTRRSINPYEDDGQNRAQSNLLNATPKMARLKDLPPAPYDPM